jgi:hypothetical protein
MKSGVAFVGILVCSGLFIVSYMFGLPGRAYGHTLNIAAQVGLAISIVAYFVLRRRP